MTLYEKRPILFGLSLFETKKPLEGHKDWPSLSSRAREEGIELKIVSNFRSFEDQFKIWNAKARGEKTLLDDQGNELNYQDLSSLDLLKSILRWSALPGLSRHHWGTDCDVIDSKALEDYLIENPDYKVELTPWEYSVDGPFSALGEFLERELHKSAFFRPYEKDLGGVAKEPWHLSHKDSLQLKESYTFSAFEEFIESDYMKDLELKDLVKEHAQWIFENYFLNITEPPRH